MKKIAVGILAHVDSGKTTLSEALLYTSGALSKLGSEFTLLDTPGHVDFSAETERTLQVLDYAILVISGSDGVQSHTQTLWRLLRRYRVPTFIFVNKMDLDSSSREVVFYQLRTKLSDGCVDFGNQDELFENVALCDEELLAKFEEDTLKKSDIIAAIKQRKVFPCLFGSALRLDGVNELNLRGFLG